VPRFDPGRMFFPPEPEEKVRLTKILLECARRGKPPSLERTYRVRRVNGRKKKYGPYYVARWRRDSRFNRGRTIYLGRNEWAIEFVRWLRGLSESEFRRLIGRVVSAVRSVVREVVEEGLKESASGLAFSIALRVEDALLFGEKFEESREGLEDVLSELPGRLRRKLGRVLGRWRPYLSLRLRERWYGR